MNVCMVLYAYYINDARVKSYVRTLENQGHRVDVITLRAEGESAREQRKNGVIYRLMSKYQGESTLLYAWSYLTFFIRAAFLLLGRAFQRRYDVVHVHNMPNLLVFAAAAPKLLGARLILDVHDVMTVVYMAKFKVDESSLPVKALKVEQKLSAAFADHVFCADHNQQDYLSSRCGIPREKITVFMNLPNAEVFRPVAVPKPSGVFRIVYHGTMAHRLGIDLVIRALADAARRIPAELWLYGGGDYLPDAIALAKEIGVEEKVHFSRKFFPVERIPEMVCGMDLGVIGNRRNLACDKYMLPVKLLEYVYLGIPVVAPRLNVITRYFDESMVRYYDPEDVSGMANAIVGLYYDHEARDRQARAAVGFYQKHNIQAQAAQYLALVTRAAAAPHAQPSERRL